MEPITFMLFGLRAAIRLEYIAYTPEPIEGAHTISINKSSPRATPLLSIVVGETSMSPPILVIRLAEDGRLAESTLPLSDIPGYLPGHPPSQAQVEAFITTALTRAGVLGRSAPLHAPIADSLPLHATLKVCTACRRWERVDETIRLYRCSGCKTFWFCDERCARAAWSSLRHQVSCRYEQAIRLQIALEGGWDYFSQLKAPLVSAHVSVRKLTSQRARLTTEIKSLRRDWDQHWSEELAAADEIDWAYLSSRLTMTHMYLEEMLAESFDVNTKRVNAIALVQNIRGCMRGLTLTLMGYMRDIYIINTCMMEMHTAGAVLMCAEGLQYVASVILWKYPADTFRDSENQWSELSTMI